MKKFVKLLFVFLFLVMGFSVHAQTYQLMDIIPISETASIDTELFTYTNFHYVTKIEGKEYGRFVFESVQNKATKSMPVSINILLFDSMGKNVGFVSYCTGEDVESDFAHKKLGAGASMPFYINVSKRYFVEGKTTEDVASFAVMDENEYCHTGGFDKYDGLTLAEISTGKVVTDKGDEQDPVDVELPELKAGFALIAISLFAAIAVLVINGLILNALHKRMYASTTPLAYLPIANNYVSVKLAFGPKMAMYFIIAFFVAIPLSFIGIGIILSGILSLFQSAAFLIVIIKLITKKYSMCYMEPFENNENVAVGGGFSLNNREAVREQYNNGQTNKSGPNEPILGDGVGEETTGEEVLDLNYNTDNPVPSGYDQSDDSTSGFTFDDKPDQSNKPEGNSDLMNLFK